MNDPTPVDDVLAVWSNGIRLRPAEIAAMHRTILADPYGASAQGPTATPPSSHTDGSTRAPISESAPPTSEPAPPTIESAPPTAPGVLPTSWWQTFAGQVAGVVVQANRPPALAGLILGGTPS
jgi:hypothetical protein